MGDDDRAAHAAPGERSRAWHRHRLVRAALWAALAAFAWWALQALVGRVDLEQVAAALGRLEPWVALPLLGALLVRQALNAVPLTFYVPGLTWGRSMRNDLAANVVATFAPPPGDVVVRLAMFRSWGLDGVLGMTGVTLNSFKFYAVRFGAPVLGLLLLAGRSLERRQWVLALACGLLAAAIVTVLALLVRSDALAATLGRTGGRLARRVRPAVDPERWAARTVVVRGQAAASLRRGLAPSMAALLGMVLADATVLLVALRAVGVTPADLPLVDVLGPFLLVYPLTTLPLFGLGVLDALLVAAWTPVTGTEAEGALVAATVVWRVVTIAGTLVLGAGVVTAWRLRHRPPAGADPAGPSADPAAPVADPPGRGTTP